MGKEKELEYVKLEFKPSIWNDDNDPVVNDTMSVSEISTVLEAMKRQEQLPNYRRYDYLGGERRRQRKNKQKQKRQQQQDQEEEEEEVEEEGKKKTTEQDPKKRIAVNEKCRMKMVEWCYEIVDLTKLKRETVCHAFSMVDRYLCTVEGQDHSLRDRSAYQMTVMTCLYLAVKLHEATMIDTELLEQLSLETFSQQDFATREVQILQTLHWRINGPTPLMFIRCYIGLLSSCCSNIHNNNHNHNHNNSSSKQQQQQQQQQPQGMMDDMLQTTIMDYAQYQAELAVFSYYVFATRLPSEVAFAAVVNAVIDLDEKVLPLTTKIDFLCTVERFSGYTITAEDLLNPMSSNNNHHHHHHPNKRGGIVTSHQQVLRIDAIRKILKEGFKRKGFCMDRKRLVKQQQRQRKLQLQQQQQRPQRQFQTTPRCTNCGYKVHIH